REAVRQREICITSAVASARFRGVGGDIHSVAGNCLASLSRAILNTDEDQARTDQTGEKGEAWAARISGGHGGVLRTGCFACFESGRRNHPLRGERGHGAPQMVVGYLRSSARFACNRRDS